MYRRLLRFLRPHAWRMAATVAASIGAAVADVFTFTLLIPFLNTLFGQPPLGGCGHEPRVPGSEHGAQDDDGVPL